MTIKANNSKFNMKQHKTIQNEAQDCFLIIFIQYLLDQKLLQLPIIISMGSENSKFLSDQELPHEYRPITQLPGVYESILNGTRLQKHKVQLNCEAQINYEKQIFVFRRMHADRLISAYFFQKFVPSHFCNMSYEVCFFTEYPAYGLTSNLMLSTQRCFQLLIDCLKGFQILFTKFGAFHVLPNHVFFDSHHQPKVWISHDFGKTKLEDHRNYYLTEQRMLIDIFRMFDQIKDERNAHVSFSNYLVKLQQKQHKQITFKSVIMYLVDEASKYFLCRTRAKPLIQLDRNHKNYNNPSTMATVKSKSPLNHHHYGNNKQNAISLKTRNKTNMKNTCSSGEFINLCTAVTNDSTGTGFDKGLNPDKVKKTKRHNSQQDCKSRQIHFFKESNKTNFCGEGLRIINIRPTMVSGQISPPQQCMSQNPSTIRLFRKSLDEFDKPTPQIRFNNQFQTRTIKPQQKYRFAPPPYQNINPSSANPRQFLNAPHQLINNTSQRHCIKIQNVSSPYSPSTTVKNMHPCQKRSSKTLKTKALDFNNHVQFLDLGSPCKENNDSHMILSNLQTLKSIVNSEYSDLDSQIRDDLENLHY